MEKKKEHKKYWLFILLLYAWFKLIKINKTNWIIKIIDRNQTKIYEKK